MELEIVKNTFLEIEKISSLKGHIGKLVDNKYDGDDAIGTIEIDISYKDINGNECFKSMSFNYEIELDDLNISDVKLKSSNVYVVEGRGISVDYVLSITYEASLDEEIDIISLEAEDEYVEEAKSIEEVLEEEKIEKIKEDISKDYENKLADNLNQRVSIVSTKNKESEIEFLRFFDEKESSYFHIKTLLCENEKELNSISKEYKISLNELLLGYDKANGKVTFRYTK
ncbi:MAG: hypothetical protein E7176_04930 [Erysipelotrichaceae bacterium]|nr:hypothetical protein [Erysipelotrichaceae bacterium]